MDVNFVAHQARDWNSFFVSITTQIYLFLWLL